MYKIELDRESRIVEATYSISKNGPGIYIDDLPGGNPVLLDDYKYIGGKILHDPRTDRPRYDPDAPTPLDNLKNENKLLHQQVEALSGQNTFLEECIAEMAGVVYA